MAKVLDYEFRGSLRRNVTLSHTCQGCGSTSESITCPTCTPAKVEKVTTGFQRLYKEVKVIGLHVYVNGELKQTGLSLTHAAAVGNALRRSYASENNSIAEAARRRK